MSDSEASEWGIERQHRWLGKPNHSPYLPSWYEPHKDLEVAVKWNGQAEGYTLRQMLPFRRWAVRPDGEILPQHEFHELYVRYIEGYKLPETSAIQNECIPNVRDFVRKKYDLHQNLVDIHFQDDGAIIKTEKFTQEGDEAPEWAAKNAEQAKSLSQIEILTKLFADGTISKEAFLAASAGVAGSSIGGVEHITMSAPIVPSKPKDPAKVARMQHARDARAQKFAEKKAAEEAARAEKIATRYAPQAPPFEIEMQGARPPGLGDDTA